MTIKQYTVPQEVIDACESRMRSGEFRASDITCIAIQSGAPAYEHREYIANRIADRLIQKHRKAGTIRLTDNRNWKPV